MITLVFCGDLRYCPYLKRYTERLERVHAEYEVLFWNRAGLSLDVPDNYHYYDSPSDESLGMARKLVDFYGFRRWLYRYLKKNHTDGLILLSTLSGLLLYPKAKKYPYIFDIRDYSFENISVFRKIEKKVIKNSSFTCISSEGFRAFLPEHPYVIAHNFNRNEIPETNSESGCGDPIRIVWNGTVRFFDYQKKYLDVFGNDPRFQLIYHGTGVDLELFKQYCVDHDIRNVLFTGAYDNKNKASLLQNADVLNNCYGGRDGDELRYAISNRFYDGLVYRIPQIVEPDGYKAGVTEKNGVGLALPPDSDANDVLYNYLQNLNRDKFESSCRTLLEKIIREDDLYINRIDQFIMEDVK